MSRRMPPASPPPARWGRAAAIALGWAKGLLASVFFLVASHGSGQDPAGRAMAGGLFLAALLYLLACVAPALVLAHRGRLIGLSFALLVVPDLLLLVAAFTL